ncbi:MAG: hypothetical protein V1846_02770 [Candidatus Komeilibacteria bacterium]
MKYLIIVIVVIILAAGGVAGWYYYRPQQPSPVVLPPTGQQVYTNSSYHFSAKYNPPIIATEDKQQMQTSGYIPGCDPDTSLVCFIYPADAFGKTNFGGAGVSVSVLANLTNETTCLATQQNDGLLATSTVMNNLTWQTWSFSDAATSHRSNGYNYRSWQNNLCWQLQTRINSTVFEVYAPGMIELFTATEEETVNQALQKTINSFQPPKSS